MTKMDFSNNVSDGFKSSVALTLDVEQEAVLITNITESTDLGKRLLREYSSNGLRRLTTQQLLVDYDVKVVTVKSENASEKVHLLIKSMEENILSGNFSKTFDTELMVFGVVLNVTMNSLEVRNVKMTYNTVTPSVLPSVAPSLRTSPHLGSAHKSDDTTTIVLVVIGSVIGFFAVICLTYVYCKNKEQKIHVSDIYV